LRNTYQTIRSKFDDKYKFKRRNIEFLGYTIGVDGLNTDPANIEKILNCPVLTDVIGVRKFTKLSKSLKLLLKKDTEFH